MVASSTLAVKLAKARAPCSSKALKLSVVMYLGSCVTYANEHFMTFLLRMMWQVH